MDRDKVQDGMRVWWRRLDRELRPFETLAMVKGEVVTTENKYSRSGYEVNIEWLNPHREKGEAPYVNNRVVDIAYLTPFNPGDGRIWERVNDRGPYSTVVRVLEVEEETGLLRVTCDLCPHVWNGVTSEVHRVRPRFVKKPTSSIGNSESRPTNSPTQVRPAVTRLPVVPTPDRVDVDFEGVVSDLQIVAGAVHALGEGKTPTPQQLNHVAQIAKVAGVGAN